MDMCPRGCIIGPNSSIWIGGGGGGVKARKYASHPGGPFTLNLPEHVVRIGPCSDTLRKVCCAVYSEWIKKLSQIRIWNQIFEFLLAVY